MKTITISIIILLFTFKAFSQADFNRQEVSTSLAMGFSGLKDNVSSGKKSFLPGGSFGLGYTYFFTPQWGATTGAELAFYKLMLEDVNGTPQSGSAGVSISQWVNFIQIPLLLQFQTRGKNVLYLSGGFKVGFPVYSTYPAEIKTAYVMSGDAGMKWKLNSRLSLYTGLFGDLGLNKLLEDEGTSNMLSAQSSSFWVDRQSVGAFGLRVRLAFGLK